MCTIPLDLERRLERRWAARFLRPVSPAATPKHWLEERTQQLAAPGKGNRQDRPAGLDFVAIKLARTRLKRRLVESRRQRSFESREATLFHVKGMEAKHMTWWKKSEPTEAWEIEDEEKIGDLELARQIREICNSVADSAEAVSVLYYGPPSETKKREIDRYERAKKRAEKKIEQISDELLRDTAIYQVLNFYMKATDVENAERLFHQIQNARITELVKSEHPMFQGS
jgi:hypothetical protein